MKTLLYTGLIMMFLLASCKSLDKLVDEGRYDEAIVLATKKLAGKKNPKTKHIRALEEAFSKVNKRDLDYIKLLKSRGINTDWEAVYDYALQIELRQSRVAPFLPLISKENYAGSFDLVNVHPILNEAADKAAEQLYFRGNESLEESKRTSNKFLAQEAYHYFDRIGKYVDQYKDVHQLIKESGDLGVFNILVTVENYSGFPLPLSVLDVNYRNLRDIDSRWKRHYTDFENNVSFDGISTIRIDFVDISPEREFYNTIIEQKDLESWIDDIDENGNVRRDSSGQVIRIKQLEKVRAEIIEVSRSKELVIRGHFETSDFVSGRQIGYDTFRHDVYFASDACNFSGDRRAISDNNIKRLDLRLLPFPNDYDMITEGLLATHHSFVDFMRRININDLYQSSLASK